MDRDQEAKIIREEWFANHIATLTQCGDMQVLSWRKPETSMYAVRYVFDKHYMYITGDIGVATFELSWKADVHSFNGVFRDYFHKKLKACTDDKWSFCNEKAIRGLREWLKDLKERKRKYDHDEMQQLFEEARECSSESGWAHVVNSHYAFISELDQDFTEWMYSAGNVIPIEVHAYLIGLQMASSQLKSRESEQCGA